MSLENRLVALAEAIGADIKQLRESQNLFVQETRPNTLNKSIWVEQVGPNPQDLRLWVINV